MLQANKYLQLGKQEEAYDIIQQLLNSEAISFEYDQPADSSQAVGGSTAPNTQTMPTSYQGTYNHTQNTYSQDPYANSQDQGRPNNLNQATNLMEQNLLNDIEGLVGADDSKQPQSIFSNQSMFANWRVTGTL